MSESPVRPRLHGAIRYVCVAEGHAADRTSRTAPLNPVTIYNGTWAFCPLDALGDGHVWQRVEAAADPNDPPGPSFS